MKVAVYAYPRSGSTLLQHLIGEHLLAGGKISKRSLLHEPITPSTKHRLEVGDDNWLWMNWLSDIDTGIDPQSREQRFDLLRRYDRYHDYLIKILGSDTLIPGLVQHVRREYKVVAITRRNLFSAYLSAIVAYEHQVWSAREGENTEYHKFTAPAHVLTRIGLNYTRYYAALPYMNPDAMIYYEDLVEDVEGSLDKAGLLLDDVPVPEPRTKKIHGFEEKASLVNNMDEIVEAFVAFTTPLGLDMETNDL